MNSSDQNMKIKYELQVTDSHKDNEKTHDFLFDKLN
jgi:hypothetical protein